MTVLLERVAKGDDDGDSYARVGTGEAELYANNPAPDAVPAPNGETYVAVDVATRARRALGGAAFEGSYRSDRVMPRRLVPQFGRFAIGPVELN
jgi:hypothetical protein